MISKFFLMIFLSLNSWCQEPESTSTPIEDKYWQDPRFVIKTEADATGPRCEACEQKDFKELKPIIKLKPGIDDFAEQRPLYLSTDFNVQMKQFDDIAHELKDSYNELRTFQLPTWMNTICKNGSLQIKLEKIKKEAVRFRCGLPE